MIEQMQQQIRIAINGYSGRMGARVASLVERDERFIIAALKDGEGLIWCDDAREVHAVIDFSTDAGARSACTFAQQHNAALLIATTALSDATRSEIDSAARSIPLIIAANTSYGIAVVDNLLTAAAKMLADRFDVAIVEAHHRHKRDRPSGTALRLAATIEQAADVTVAKDAIHALRMGDVVGDHEVIFASDEEVIGISHRALTRDVFARGALRAVQWLVGQQPGAYDIRTAWGLQ